MQSSRIILNSRYFHIAQPGEKADGKFSMTKDAAAGLVDYVATREGVSLNFNALDLNFKTSQKPATLPQIRIIEKLIKEFPETKDTFEYKDFRTNPNIGNASEFIARAAELGLGYSGGLITDEATNLVEYVAKRPGVDRVGKHGLFSSSKNVSISKAQDEIANCKGNIWTHVISIRREDADMLGYDHQKPWRDMVISKIDKIAKASNIPISQLHWYAGMHNTGHHPHIHLFVFSDDATCGHLSVEGINQMKAEFSEVIFHDERQHIYEHKDEIRNEIKDQVENLLSDIQENPTGQFKETEIKNISTELKELAATLNSLDGKKSYGYLPRNIKEQVNQIMADLSTAPNIQKLYELYCNDHKELEKMYRNEPDEAISIINNKEFTSVKNQIIKEAVKLQDLVSLKSGSTSAFYKEQKRDIHQSEDNKISSLLSANDESLFENEPPIADNSYEEYDISESYEADQQETRQSFSDDESLFNAEPPHELKQAHTDDYEPPVNEAPPSFHQSHKAVEDFSSTYNNAVAGDTESRYQIAKCYFYGKGVEQDYTQAQMWYGLAAASGHSSAKYELGKMYLYGIGIEKDIKLGTDYCLDAYWDFRGTIAEKTGIDIGHEIDDTNIPLEMLDLPSADKHIGYLEYCLGRMEYAGEGVTRDYEKSAKWFAAASFHDHVHSQYYLGKQYYGGEGVTQNYNDAAGWYKSAAQNKDKYAMYALGKMYYNGKGVEQDYKQAAKWYSKASQNNVSYADYALAKMCEQGFGVDKDIEVSCILYKKALDEFISQEKQQPDAITEYRIAQMYLTGKGTEPNLKNAVEWFTKCAENDDPRAQYQLADLYQRGEGVKPDETKAHELYHKALHGFIKIENETPSAAQEYKIAKMYQKGLGTDVNMSEAINWFTIAAENNHPHAAYQLGKFYIGGVFVKKDCAAAINWFTKSAEAEDKYAMYALGKMYYNGTGVEQDYKEAVEWYSKASQHNVSYADYALAKMLEQGLGVDKNLETSSTLYKKSLVEFISQEQQQPDAVTEYRIAEMYLKGKGVERSAALAAEWLVKSAAMENCDAQYQLAALYQRGEGVQIDKIKSYELYQKALGGFTKAEEDESNAVREYKIAQLFQKGLGTEVNNGNSANFV